MRKLRVLVLMHESCVPPENAHELLGDTIPPWKSEYDIMVTLEGMGHEVRSLGVHDEIAPLREAVRVFKPHIVFNLLEEFGGLRTFVPFVLGYLELLRQPYTGCNPEGLMLASGKALQRKILRHHRVPVPEFVVFPRGRAVQRPQRLTFPLIVKSATAHGSVGIAQSSVVHDDEKLRERVEFIFETMQTDAIVEQYIDGRELYLGVIGNRRLEVFPVWEMVFENLPDGAARIATERIKWNLEYQAKIGVKTKAAEGLSKAEIERIGKTCKRAYRALEFSGHARMDMRLTPTGELYILECNPNANLGYGDDFAESAEAAGVKYEELLQRLLILGLRQAGAPRD